jgi:hypothetical protein
MVCHTNVKIFLSLETLYLQQTSLFYSTLQFKTKRMCNVWYHRAIRFDSWNLEEKKLWLRIFPVSVENIHIVAMTKCTFYLTNHITLLLKFFQFTNCRNIRVRISTGSYWFRISERKNVTLKKKFSWYFSVTPRQCLDTGNSFMYILYLLSTAALLTFDDVDVCCWNSVVK